MQQQLRQFLAASTPQDGTHPRHQLARGERLGHVVVGAELEPHDAIALLAARGQEDHRDGPARADRAAELESADAGEHHVEHDEVRRLALDEPGHFAAVARRDDAKAVAGEVLPDDVPDGGLVVDDEHGARRLHSAIVAAADIRTR